MTAADMLQEILLEALAAKRRKLQLEQTSLHANKYNSLQRQAKLRQQVAFLEGATSGIKVTR